MALGPLLVLWYSFVLPACANYTLFNNTASLQFEYTASLQFKQSHSRFSRETPFLTLYNLAVNNCVYECQIRLDCEAVNFWRTRKQCDLLTNDTFDLDRSPAGRPCVYVRKSDVKESSKLKLSSICPPCNSTEVCDLDTSQCVIRECRNNAEPNAKHKGNVLSVGSWITLKCQKWFVPETFVHGKRAPVLRSQCQNNGTWSDIPPCLYRFDCGLPPELPNARADRGDKYQASPRSKESNVVLYKCNSGYATPSYSMNMTLACFYNISGDPSNFTWAEPEFQCIRNCREPGLHPNALITTGENLENMTRTYYCSPGYVLDTTGTWNDTMELNTTCQPTGDWTDVNFECIPVCGDVPELAHAYTSRMFADGNRTLLEYTCHTNYTMTAPYTGLTADVECLNGNWTDPYFHCVRECPMPPVLEMSINNSVPEPESFGWLLEGTVITYTCETGWILNGTGVESGAMTANILCQPDGNWTPVDFECVSVCAFPPSVPNAVVADTFTYSPGSTITADYNCIQGYSQTSSISLNCSSPGQWSESTETCIRDCYQPPDIENATLSDGPTVAGSIRTYTCNTGFRVNGTKSYSITCQPDGNWTSPMFQCDQKTCPGGWILHADYCLLYGESTISRSNISTYCETIHPGSYMVELEDAAKEANVINFLEQRSAYSDTCLGLHKDPGSGNLTWHGTGTPMTYSNFVVGVPEASSIYFSIEKTNSIFKWNEEGGHCYPLCELF